MATTGRGDGTILVNRCNCVIAGRPAQFGAANRITILVVGSRNKRLRGGISERHGCDRFPACIRNRNPLDFRTGLIVGDGPRLLSSIAIHLGKLPR